MSLADTKASTATAGGSAGNGFPKRQLSGDLRLRLARLPSVDGGGGAGGGGVAENTRRGRSRNQNRGSSAEIGTSCSNAPSMSSSRDCHPAAARRLSLTSARDGFSLVPTTGSVGINGGVDSSRLNWKNPLSGQRPLVAGGAKSSGRKTSGTGGESGECATRSPSDREAEEKFGAMAGARLGAGGGAAGVGAEAGINGDGEDGGHAEFMRELALQNGLQLRCPQREEERARHRREVERRIGMQESCIRRPSVEQSKSLLKAKILGSIGGGPFELLRAFRKMHCGRGTVIDFGDFREAVQKLGLGLTEPEILSFFRSFDADGSGGIDFSEFCEWVGGTHDETDGDGGGSRGGGGFRPSSSGSDKSVSKRKMRDAQARVKAASEKVPERTMAETEQLLREKILGSIGGGPFQLLRAFRKMHRGRGTVVDLNDFREAVTTFSLGLGEAEVVAFFKGFDSDGSGGIDFEEFCAWVGGADAAGSAEKCILPDSKPRHAGGAIRGESGAFSGGGGGRGRGQADEDSMTPTKKAQEKVANAFHEQAGKMSSETLHRVLREKLITTVKPGGGTLLRTYHNLHRTGNVGGVGLADFKEAVHRYGMGVTDAQVERLFRRYDKDGSGDIDFHEFLKLIMYAEELAPEEARTSAAVGGEGEGEDEDETGDVRPLSPGWAARATAAADERAKEKSHCGGGGIICGNTGADNGEEIADYRKGAANNETPAVTDRADDGSGGAVGASCGERQPRDTVLVASPVTKGAKAEQKIKACVRGRWRHMLNAFRRRDPLRSGTVSHDEFREVIAANKAMQSLGKDDVTALASKHAAPRRGRVDYSRLMRHLMLSGGSPTSKETREGGRSVGGAGGGRGGWGGVQYEAEAGGDGGRHGTLRPRSAASTSAKRSGLGGSKSTGALAAVASSSPSRARRVQSIVNGPAARGGGSNEQRDRAAAICRELQPHIVKVWKPLWKDLKAADHSALAKAQGGGSYGGCHGGSGGTSFPHVSSGEVETHVFSSVLARHGLELSNRDLLALEHLPAMAHKGWALPGAAGSRRASSPSRSPSSPAALAATVASSTAEAWARRGIGGCTGGDTGRIPYDSFLTTCLGEAAR